MHNNRRNAIVQNMRNKAHNNQWWSTEQKKELADILQAKKIEKTEENMHGYWLIEDNDQVKRDTTPSDSKKTQKDIVWEITDGDQVQMDMTPSDTRRTQENDVEESIHGRQEEWFETMEESKETIFNTLQEVFGDICNINILTLKAGNHMIGLREKGVDEKRHPQVLLTVTKENLVNIKLTPYDHIEEYYFMAEKVTPQQALAEIENYKSFLNNGTVSENSLIKKEEIPNMDDY